MKIKMYAIVGACNPKLKDRTSRINDATYYYIFTFRGCAWLIDEF
jgi:hypothetical protein